MAATNMEKILKALNLLLITIKKPPIVEAFFMESILLLNCFFITKALTCLRITNQ